MYNTTTPHPLRRAAHGLFADIALSKPSLALLNHFSRTELVSLCISPSNGSNAPNTIHFTGINAVRSYFDLAATHWTRSAMRLHSCHVLPNASRVVLTASVTWTWKQSGRSWTEDFTCTLDFDEQVKVKAFAVQTLSGEQTCLMRAVDA
jgi:hypothetical protein